MRDANRQPSSPRDEDRRALLADQPDLDSRLHTLRAELVDRILFGLLGLAFLATPVSILRSLHTGWLDLYTVHLAAAATIVLVYALRRRLPLGAKLAFILAVFWSIGATGLLHLGLLSAGAWWLVVSALLVSVLFSVRTGAMVTAGIVAYVGLVGWSYVAGGRQPEVDPATYLHQAAPWATLAVGTFVMPMVVFAVVAHLHANTVALLRDTEQQRLRIRELATHDGLTGAPTLTLARDRLEQAIRNSRRDHRKVAVYFLDLDGFKAINDAHGHDAGDEVLRIVIARLRKMVRNEDTIARLGGDELLGILDNFEFARDVAVKAEAMIAAIREPIAYRDTSLEVGASIGVALFPEHAVTADQLIAVADTAMYEAKRAGGNRIRIATAT